MFQSLSPSAISRWSIAHRRRVIGGWLLLLVLSVVVAKGVGNSFDNGLALPKTDSQRAVDLLQSRFPRAAGDADQIVFAARAGKLTDAAVRARVTPMLAQVARLPRVTGVSAPTISRDGSVGFATVRFDDQGDALPTKAIRRVVDTAQAPASPQLEVELNGNAVEQLYRPSPGHGRRDHRRGRHSPAQLRLVHGDGAADRDGAVRPRPRLGADRDRHPAADDPRLRRADRADDRPRRR